MSNITNVINTKEELHMTSLEIAEYCGKRHDHVLRDIDNMFFRLYPNENEQKIIYLQS